MNKSDFVAAVAEQTGANKKEIMAFVNAYHTIVTETLSKGEKVTFIGFGVYSAEPTPKRTGRNPRTGKPITIPAGVRPKFKAGKALKTSLNKKISKPTKKKSKKVNMSSTITAVPTA